VIFGHGFGSISALRLQSTGRPRQGFIPEDTAAVDTHLANQAKTKSNVQPALCFFDLV
jgi:hypothetical protein